MATTGHPIGKVTTRANSVLQKTYGDQVPAFNRVRFIQLQKYVFQIKNRHSQHPRHRLFIF